MIPTHISCHFTNLCILPPESAELLLGFFQTGLDLIDVTSI